MRESFAFKYVNACTFIGQAFVDTIIKEIEDQNALKFLTTFHILTDHPISHALLTCAGIDLTSEDWQSFSGDRFDYFTEESLSSSFASVPVKVLARPLFRDFMAMRDSGIRPLPTAYDISDLGTFDQDDLSEYQNRLTQAAYEYGIWIEKTKSQAKSATRFLKFSAYGLSSGALVAGAADFKEAAGTFLSSLIYDDAASYVVDKLQEWKFEHLVSKLFSEPPDLH